MDFGEFGDELLKPTKPVANNIVNSLKDPNRLPLILKSVALLLSVIAIYFQDLSLIFADALYYEASSHVLILPFLIAYMVYRKRKVVFAIVQNDEVFATKQKLVELAAGFLFCLIALMVYFYGSQTFTPLQYHIFTLPLFVAGLILVLFNPKTLRELFVPVVFTVFFVGTFAISISAYSRQNRPIYELGRSRQLAGIY